MSWHYLRELGGESLEDICSGGEQCVQLKSKITHAVFYCNGKLMDSYLDSLSGTMLEPLTENLGKEKSMLSAVDSHARTSVLRGGGGDLMVKDQDYGAKWQGSFAKYDPNTHSLKTHQCLLFEDSTESCVTLPRWGLMQDGECWEQMTLVQTMKEKESGLLQKYPTPSASDGTRGTMPNWVPIRPSGHPAQYPLNQALRDLTGIIGKPNPIFVEWLMGWPMQWTDLKPLEMDKFHLWQQQHGNF